MLSAGSPAEQFHQLVKVAEVLRTNQKTSEFGFLTLPLGDDDLGATMRVCSAGELPDLASAYIRLSGTTERPSSAAAHAA